MEQIRNLLGMIRRPFEELDLDKPLPGFLTSPLSLGVKNPSLRRALGNKGGQRRRKSTRSRSNKSRSLQFTLEGTLEQGYNTLFSINGYDLTTTADTWIFGELVVGNHAKVKGVIVHGHERVCTSVIATPP